MFHLSLVSVLSWIIGYQWSSGLGPWSLLSLVPGPCAAPLLGSPPPAGNHPTTSPRIVFLPAPNQDGNTGKKFWKSVLFVWFQTKPFLVGYENGPIGKVISSSFRAYAECTKRDVGQDLGLNVKASWSRTPNCNRGEICEVGPNPCSSLCTPT
jgi:hypothetical protein